jgi:hypothetical protein
LAKARRDAPEALPVDLPECPFLLFGMGDRRKMLFRDGTLSDARTGDVIRRWEPVGVTIRPSWYRVELDTPSGPAAISEDERGIWVDEGGSVEPLAEGALSLPTFAEHTHGDLLRVLYHEILVNVIDGLPVPNYFVYRKPWYRDAAMMCMCLEKTGSLSLVQHWIDGLREPYDENNRCREPDNLGQALYLISLVADASHPLVDTVLAEAERIRDGRHITGTTDGAPHPVYQTKWLKYGLRSLGLDDPWEIPNVPDSYSALFWMDYRDAHVPGNPFPDRAKQLYPYLGWAEGHFHRWKFRLPPAEWRYPLTWEASSSQADYEGMSRVCREYVEARTCAPHTWHAAEMFLYATDLPGI